MNGPTLLRYLPLALSVFIAVVFVQSLLFKFSNSFETQHIFGTIGSWMGDVGLPAAMADLFADYGGYAVGTAELIAALLLLRSSTRFIGALLSLLVISGAVFFHLFTPLGVSVVIDEAGNRDGGQLFALAVGVLAASLLILWLTRPGHTAGPAGVMSET